MLATRNAVRHSRTMTPNQQLATLALALVRNSNAPTDDNTQEGIRAVKTWLGSIASGESVVGKPVVEPEKTAKKGRTTRTGIK